MSPFEILLKLRMTVEGAEWLAEVLPPGTNLGDVAVHHYTMNYIANVLGFSQAEEHRETIYQMSQRIPAKALGFDFFKIFRIEVGDGLPDIFYSYAVFLPSPLQGANQVQ